MWETKSFFNYEIIILHWKIKNVLLIKQDSNVEKMNKTNINNFKEVKDLGMIIDVEFKERVKTFLECS